ncbi:glycosyltransferase [Rothia sp. ZJ932]|uniref:CgeB family protein n=1 Tax=Rothia sp. ZJ932 TaxID=2810516 RepID=UPI001967D4FD|nr:glycosyltransferase [Rothia sp. ZJ932]QRZ61205.1 glycosyltransferase [Rothia sp. ZJ932]
MKKEKLLIISPSFHGYCYSIADGFNQVGYDTTVYRYDAFDRFQEKFRNKVFYELPGKLGFDGKKIAEKDATSKAIETFHSVNPDKLIVIKADTLGDSFWEAVNESKIPYMLWLYDDFSRHRYTHEFLSHVPTVLSYARTEAEVFSTRNINSHFVPNAYNPKLTDFPVERTNEIVFVGSRYENREELVLALAEAGIPVRAYGRQWSHHPFDRLRTWEIKRPNIPAERDIPLSEAYKVQAGAAGALNIHGLQAGLAMRTFEVPGMQGIQLIDRLDVAEFYEPGEEVLIYQSLDELIELSQRLVRDPQWSEKIREAGYKRSVAEHTFFHRAQGVDQLWA